MSEKNTITSTTQSRWKSPVVWGAIASGVISILVAAGVFTAGQRTSITDAVSFILQALTLFGVLNNPTDSASF